MREGGGAHAFWPCHLSSLVIAVAVVTVCITTSLHNQPNKYTTCKITAAAAATSQKSSTEINKECYSCQRDTL